MSTVSVDEETKKRVIEDRKAGVSMRVISKKYHLSFTTISKIWNEREGQTDSSPEKLITTKAFQLFEKGMNLVQVTIELDLNPAEAENIQRSYLRQKGLDEIVKYSETVKKHLSSFIDFVTTCEEHTPESQKLVEIFNLLKVIDGLKTERLNLECWCRFYERLVNKLKQEVKEIEQRIEKLKQHEYNKWYESFASG
jgi:hypothetical protein